MVIYGLVQWIRTVFFFCFCFLYFFSCSHAGKGLSAHIVEHYLYHSRTLYPPVNLTKLTNHNNLRCSNKIHTVISLGTHVIFFSACINLYNWPIDSFFLHSPHSPQSSSGFLPVLSHTCYYFPPWCHLHAALRERKWTEMLLTSCPIQY